MKKVKLNKHRWQKKTVSKSGQFLLNASYSDRLSFSFEINDRYQVLTITNVSYEILYEQEWKWIVRYDDHGGTDDFHLHERISLDDNSSFPILSHPMPKGSKNRLLAWAIKDIRDHYLTYRSKFCKRNHIDLY